MQVHDVVASPRVITAWAVCATLCVSLLSCDSRSSVVPGEGERLSYDAGLVFVEKDGDIWDHEFEFKNSSSETAQLSVRSTSCTCLDVELSRNRVPPSGSSLVRARGRLGFETEERRLLVNLETGLSDRPLITYDISLDVLVRLKIIDVPETVLAVPPGEERQFKFQVVTHREPRTQANELRVEIPSPLISVSQLDREVLEGEGYRRCVYTYVGTIQCPEKLESVEVGEVHEEVITAKGGDQLVQSLIKWKIDPPISISPSVLYANVVDGPATVSFEAASDTAFSILSASIDDADAQVAFSKNESRNHTIEVGIPGGSDSDGNFRKLRVKLTTDHDDMRELQVPVFTYSGSADVAG